MSVRGAFLFGIIVSCQAGAVTYAASLTPTYLTNFPHFSAKIETDAPGDIDTTLEAALSVKGQFSLVQREFELYAWQLFNAVNSSGAAGSSNENTLFKDDAARWEAWPTARDAVANPTVCASFGHLATSSAAAPARMRHLRAISTLSSDDILDSTARPSSVNAPLIDQHGNFVYYESLVDPNQVTYLCANGLQSRSGVARAFKKGGVISFPYGSEDTAWSGSYTLKLAWKVLDPSKGDIPGRYYADNAQILDVSKNGQPVWREVTVGLVGMHLVHKTRSAPERIWATFEHVDNLDADTVSVQGLQPSFTNPLCPLCAQNLPSRMPLDRVPTQVARALPLSISTEKLNAEVEQVFVSRGSVWQYYKLVGVQWPGVSGDSSSATPAYLSNAVMETFLQPRPNSDGPSGMRTNRMAASSCMSCHDRAAVAGDAFGRSSRQKADFSWFMAGSPMAR